MTVVDRFLKYVTFATQSDEESGITPSTSGQRVFAEALVKELKDFRRVSLRPGEKKEVAFTLKKQDMGFYNNEGEYRLESGEFRIYVGGNSRDCLEVSMTLKF